MHSTVSDFMARNYKLFNPLWKLYFPMRQGSIHQGLRLEADDNIFEAIYKSNYWANSESRSGQGSTLIQTAPLRARLPSLIRKYGIRSIFDAPCGDFNWMRIVDLSDVAYIGGDIVGDLISDNQKNHSAPNRTFRVFDILKDPVPRADLWLCRDVLFHLTLDQGVNVVKRAANSNIKYFLSTTYGYVCDNIDLEQAGGFRTINLEKPPFNLPPPIERIDDFVIPSAPRQLGLWTREQLANL